jgi:integrase
MADERGLTQRHARACKARRGDRCTCSPTWQAQVFDQRTGRRLTKTFPNKTAARNWRDDARSALRNGTLRASSKTTVGEAWDRWLEEARAGVIRNRSGDRYKPSALRGYSQSFELRLRSEIARRPLSDLRRGELQRLVDKLSASGLSASTVQCSLLPLRALYRHALSLDEVAANPCTGLRLPAVRGKRDRIASPAETAALLDALPLADRAIWATAMYGGLRRGELLALEWRDVDLQAGKIRVERSWDITEQDDVGPKSAEGKRTVPVASKLKTILAEHRLASGRADGYVFGDGDRPFSPSALTARCDAAWAAAGLDRLTLHEGRHTYASLMIAAGVNAKALSTYMGHANISITLDRYGHLMPGNENEAAGLLDRFLAAADGA